jgi:hypothetical protein
MADHSSHQQHEHGGNHLPYETSDADVHSISVWTIGIFVTMFVAMGLMGAMVFGLLKLPVDLGRTPTAMEMERSLPPTPRLQVDQAGDLSDFRAQEDAALSSYGRQSNSGAIRVPIERAIEIMAARQSAAAPAPAAERAKPEAAKPERAKPAAAVKH